ncbi:MAG: adenosylhomocysteinase, partial [Candidatus Altiarchaeales archaeon]|nr:adenosylhomocysteinase [Candidatus Altiarchaeales archaeon]
FVTVTGDKDVLRKEHMEKMKNNAVIANSGHFNVEINTEDLESISTGKKRIRENVEKYTLRNGKFLYLLAEGRLVNLAAAEGHPSEVMDMSFSNQALAVRYLLENDLTPGVHVIPAKIDEGIADLKLKTMGIDIDTLSEQQKTYLESWGEGT